MERENGYKPIPFVRELCKHKTEEEIREAEENFREYLRLLMKVSHRIARNKRHIDEKGGDTI